MNADDDPDKAFRLFLPYGVSLSMGAENWPPLVSETADHEPVYYALYAAGTLPACTAGAPCKASLIIPGASMSLGVENWPPLVVEAAGLEPPAVT